MAEGGGCEPKVGGHKVAKGDVIEGGLVHLQFYLYPRIL